MPATRNRPTVPAEPIRASPRKRKLNNESVDIGVPTSNGLAGAPPSPLIEQRRVSVKRVRVSDSAADDVRAISGVGASKTVSDHESVLKAVEDEAKADLHLSNTKSGKTKLGKGGAASVKHEEATDTVNGKVASGSAPKKSKPTKQKASVLGKDEKPEKVVRKRKTKEEKEAEAMPLASRTVGLKMFVGAHVSIAKGLENAITNSLHIGGNAFALFLKSQRKWDNPGLKDENRNAFKQHCTHHHYDQSSHVVPHGSYLVNLASPDKEMSKKSYDAFVDDLHRCEALGIKYYNFHPGSTNKEPLDEAIARLANNLNRALAETSTVVPLLENMAGHGSIIGSRFTDLRDIIVAIKPEFKSRIGICIDTCHTFAAGYDLRSPEAFKKTMKDLDEVVGLKYLKALHINDSKAPFGSHRDLHQNIGAGFLGLRAFHNVMNDARLENLPLILETPCDKPDPDNPKKTIDDKNVWAREIKLLESLIGMDPESKEFKRLEQELSEQGRAEREKMERSIEVRDEKARKKAQKELERGQKSISTMLGDKAKKRKGSVSSSSGLSDAGSNV